MDDKRLFHLSDEQWAQIEGAFPKRRGTSGFERKISNRLAFEAVLFRAGATCQVPTATTTPSTCAGSDG